MWDATPLKQRRLLARLSHTPENELHAMAMATWQKCRKKKMQPQQPQSNCRQAGVGDAMRETDLF